MPQSVVYILYTVSQKNCHFYCLGLYFRQMLTDFQNFFTQTSRGQLAKSGYWLSHHTSTDVASTRYTIIVKYKYTKNQQ